MRHNIKRWQKKILSDIRARKRKASVTAELQKFFDLPNDLQMTQSGGDGTDNIYFVSHEGKTLGVLRLATPDEKRKIPSSSKPYSVMNAKKRIDYEWAMYTEGAAHNLTPKSLWRTHDALLCEYLPCKKLQNTLIKEPDKAWYILCRAARAIGRLHDVGITHMDVCLQNMLGDAQGNIYFIDFEYMPAKHILPPAQRVYDHLRLIEAAWKFIPADKKADFGVWLDYFTSCMDDEMRQVNLSLFERDLSRMLEAKELKTRIRRLFINAL